MSSKDDVLILVTPCDAHRDWNPSCLACQSRERENYWARQRKLSQEAKKA